MSHSFFQLEYNLCTYCGQDDLLPSELGTERTNKLTTECCGRETTELEDEFVAAGLIDYVRGKWVNLK